MKEILKEMYAHGMEMQKIAETKNAGLIAFNGALLIATFKFIDSKPANVYFGYYLYFSLFFCIISIFLNLSSTVAQLKHKELEIENHNSHNLLYFGTVANKTPEELLEAIRNKYQIEELSTEYFKDLAKQSIIVSQIALRKFKFFNAAFIFTICAIATPLSAVDFLLFYNPNK